MNNNAALQNQHQKLLLQQQQQQGYGGNLNAGQVRLPTQSPNPSQAQAIQNQMMSYYQMQGAQSTYGNLINDSESQGQMYANEQTNSAMMYAQMLTNSQSQMRPVSTQNNPNQMRQSAQVLSQGQINQVQMNSRQPQFQQIVRPAPIYPSSYGFVKKEEEGQINTMNTFSNPRNQSLNQRATFDVAFSLFLARGSGSIPSIPLIQNKPLDIFLFFHYVIIEGGYERVNLSNSWARICPKIRLESTIQNCTAIKSYYALALLRLEEGVNGNLHQDIQVPQQPQVLEQVPAPAPIPIVVEDEDSEEEGVYHVKSRIITTLGGLDIPYLSPVLSRPRPTKELYNPRNYGLVNMALLSRLPGQIKFGLDLLLIVSAESVRLSDCPDLLETLLDFGLELIENLDDVKGSSRMFSYKELFEIESTILCSLQSNCVTAIDFDKRSREHLIIISQIFRNCALNYDNHNILSSCSKFNMFVSLLLTLKVPEEHQEILDNNLTLPPLTLSSHHILEHRKNCLIILSSLGHCFNIAGQDLTGRIAAIILDFVSESGSPYVYPSVDALARLLLKPQNHSFFMRIDSFTSLVNGLLMLLPPNGFQVGTASSQIAEWELTMMSLSLLISNLDLEKIKEIDSLPYIHIILLNMIKRPKFGLIRPTPDGALVFSSMRERALRILLILNVASGRYEEDLVATAIHCVSNGEAWMCSLILGMLATPPSAS